MRANRLATAGATAALMVGPVLALAGDDIHDDTVSSCTGTNCSSVRLPGSVSASGVHANPWTINALARTGECVRFDLISPPSPSPDMEMIVVAPNGTVFRNDDRSPTDLRPLVKIGPAPTPGWYRVVVTQFAGAPIEAFTVMLYGRYSAGNPNCNTPTTPLAGSLPGVVDADELAEAAKSDSLAPTRKTGQTEADR
jgi:hypothetical protein